MVRPPVDQKKGSLWVGQMSFIFLVAVPAKRASFGCVVAFDEM